MGMFADGLIAVTIAGGLFKALGDGTIWVAAVAIAGGLLLSRVMRLIRQTVEIHGVLLGSDSRPSLSDRLDEGERRFDDLEDKVDHIHTDVGAVAERVGNVERSLDVMRDAERFAIRAAISRAAVPGSSDPPPMRRAGDPPDIAADR